MLYITTFRSRDSSPALLWFTHNHQRQGLRKRPNQPRYITNRYGWSSYIFLIGVGWMSFYSCRTQYPAPLLKFLVSSEFDYSTEIPNCTKPFPSLLINRCIICSNYFSFHSACMGKKMEYTQVVMHWPDSLFNIVLITHCLFEFFNCHVLVTTWFSSSGICLISKACRMVYIFLCGYLNYS